MIDITHAQKSFSCYLKRFDAENEKIRLKIIHTNGVVRCATEIARRMELDEEDRQLAKLIALLHDIGRFEQVRVFDSFEPAAMDHAAYGAGLLFGSRQMIRQFIKEDTWDDIIREAIARHSDFSVGTIEDERTLLHAKLIRDADKLDNCRVKLEDPVRVLLDMDGDKVGKQEISDRIWKTCLNHESIPSRERRTKMDYWVSYLAYFFDINFTETFSIIQEERYVDRIIGRIPYTNPDTKEKIEKLRRILNDHVRSRVIQAGLRK